MAKGKLIEQLDDAVEALVAKPNAPVPASDPRLAAILRIAGELRDLPRADFKHRLKAELAAQSREIESAAAPPPHPESEPAPAPAVSRSIMPFLYIAGAASAVEFYKSVFGASVLMREDEPSGIVSHAMLKMGDTTVMLSDPTSADVQRNDTHGLSRTPRSYGGSPVHLYIYVADVDQVFERAIQAGAKVIDVVEDRDWGDRCGGIEDPYGHVWWVGTPIKDLPPKNLK